MESRWVIFSAFFWVNMWGLLERIAGVLSIGFSFKISLEQNKIGKLRLFWLIWIQVGRF